MYKRQTDSKSAKPWRLYSFSHGWKDVLNCSVDGIWSRAVIYCRWTKSIHVKKKNSFLTTCSPPHAWMHWARRTSEQKNNSWQYWPQFQHFLFSHLRWATFKSYEPATVFASAMCCSLFITSNSFYLYFIHGIIQLQNNPATKTEKLHRVKCTDRCSHKHTHTHTAKHLVVILYLPFK